MTSGSTRTITSLILCTSNKLPVDAVKVSHLTDGRLWHDDWLAAIPSPLLFGAQEVVRRPFSSWPILPVHPLVPRYTSPRSQTALVLDLAI
jgi:hypothetical protein